MSVATAAVPSVEGIAGLATVTQATEVMASSRPLAYARSVAVSDSLSRLNTITAACEFVSGSY